MISKADIKLIKSLADRQTRIESGVFAVEGFKMVAEVLVSDYTVTRIFITRGTENEVTAAGIRGAIVEEISPAEMERISHFKTPPGILALVKIPDRPFIDPSRDKLILALDGIQDPGNLGTIIRIADWFGIGDIVCSPGSADCNNPKTVQATMGALFRVNVHYLPLEGLLSGASEKSVPVYGTVMDGDNIYEAQLSESGIIVMGSESHGISPEVGRLLSHRLLIPPYPADRHGSESLNVATAAAIVCAEFRRRQR